MGILKKKNVEKQENTISENSEKFEAREDLQKLVLYFVIVPFGQGENIIRLFKNSGSSAQFIKVGKGSATKQIREILNIEDNRKEIVVSIISEQHIEDMKRELDAYFIASKKNAGIGFTIALDSIVGVKVYKFLSQTIRG